MAKRKTQKDVNTKKRTHQSSDGVFEFTPEMSDIPGNQVQLKVKERDLEPFFKSLLDKHKPLPKHVSFRCYDAPTMSEVIGAVGLAGVVCIIPVLAVLIGSVIYRKVDIAGFIIVGLLLFAFGCSMYWARNKYRDVKDYRAGKYRYGRFLCRYALFVRYKGFCQIFPRHKVVETEMKKSWQRAGGSRRQWWHLYLYYLDDTGQKSSYQIFAGAGGTPIDKPLQNWIQKPLPVRPLVRALEAEDSNIRLRAATILQDIDWQPENPEQQTLFFLAQKNWTVLKAMSSAISREVLIKALSDHDPTVRTEMVNLLENLGWEPGNDPETVYYLFARKKWETFLVLGAPTRVEALLNVLGRDAPVFREEATTTLASLYALVDGVIFGVHQPANLSQRFTLRNPDVSDLIFPMSQLKRILIATDTYDFFLVERFMTYAVNSIGRKHLKKQVEVHLYGNPDRLHRNLRNMFTNLCKSVHAD
jgi:hypothetical protein